MPGIRAVDAALIVLGTARLTRLVTEDSLGYWWFVGPVRGWANRHDAREDSWVEPDPDLGWRSKLASGLVCRWCVGFWLGGLVLTADVLTRTTVFGWARPLLRFGLGVLALNAASNAVGKWTGTLS